MGSGEELPARGHHIKSPTVKTGKVVGSPVFAGDRKNVCKQNVSLKVPANDVNVMVEFMMTTIAVRGVCLYWPAVQCLVFTTGGQGRLVIMGSIQLDRAALCALRGTECLPPDVVLTSPHSSGSAQRRGEDLTLHITQSLARSGSLRTWLKASLLTAGVCCPHQR